MSAATVVLLIVAAAVATSVASVIVFKTVGVELRRRHLEVGTAVFLQLGVIYAVFLAFVFGQALDSFVAADNAISAECAALHGASILAQGLPEPMRVKLAGAMRAYTDAVIDDEWRAMQEMRRGSPTAFAREQEMLGFANSMNVIDARDIRVADRVVASLVEAHRNREERLFQAGQGIPTGLWMMILVYAAALVGLVLFSSLEYLISHAVLSGIFGALSAVVLLAVFVLQYPFEGPFRLSSEDFVLTRAKIIAASAGEAPPSVSAKPRE